MSETQNPDVIQPQGAKDPILILILSLFLGPIAYFITGQWQKGLAGIGAWIVGVALTIVTCGIGTILMVPLGVIVVIDSYMQSKSLKEGHPIGQWTFFGKHL
jgi:hypothetical protein